MVCYIYIYFLNLYSCCQGHIYTKGGNGRYDSWEGEPQIMIDKLPLTKKKREDDLFTWRKYTAKIPMAQKIQNERKAGSTVVPPEDCFF